MKPPMTLCLLTGALALAPAAGATVTPTALAVDAGGLAAVRMEHGVLVRGGDGAFRFSCQALMGPGTWLVAPVAGKLLDAGPDGVQLTTDDGCKWRAPAGDWALEPSVGVHVPYPAESTVLFGIGGELVARKVAVTTDGGQTGETLPALAPVQAEALALVGAGARLVVVTRGADGGVRLWRTEDLGQSFDGPVNAAAPLDGASTIDPAGLAADGGTSWFWVDGALVAVDPATGQGVSERSYGAGARPRAAVGPDGRLWLAGPGGLEVRETDGTIQVVRGGAASAVVATGDAVWLGTPVEADGDPLVWRSTDGGGSWEVALAASADPGFPATCATLNASACAADLEALRAGLGIAPEPDVAEPSPPSDEGCAGAGGGGVAAGLALLAFVLLWRRRDSAGRRWA